MVKIIRKPTREVINIDSDGYILDSEGIPTEELYDPLEGINAIHTFYWYNDLQGRFIQDTRAPGFYRGRPRIYLKEIVERAGPNILHSHMFIYYGKTLLAKTGMITPEYNVDEDGNRNDDDIRFQVRNFARELINQSRAPTNPDKRVKFVEGAWKDYQVPKPFKEFQYRKAKKSPSKKVKRSTKPIEKKRKVVRKKKIVKKRK